MDSFLKASFFLKNSFTKLADELKNGISIKNVHQSKLFQTSPCKTISNNCNDDSYLNDDELNDKVFIHPETINSSLGCLNKKDYHANNLLETTKRDHKSRSMSLPVTYSDIDLFSSDQESSQSGFQQVSSSSNNSLLSPMRKFDFTFCKYIRYMLIVINPFVLFIICIHTFPCF